MVPMADHGSPWRGRNQNHLLSWFLSRERQVKLAWKCKMVMTDEWRVMSYIKEGYQGCKVCNGYFKSR
ncbi:hypothetical protein HanIR_Chr07g0322881 [Helianthus annuus]|nr:hypothetical protein HanIR_Chr07g0322881 [Helianthus annuus]